MAFTAELIDIAKRDDTESNQVFSILYVDPGKSKVRKDYARRDFSLSILRHVAQTEIASLNARPPIVDLTGVSLGVIDVTPDIQPDPTPEELARREFFVVYRRAQTHQRAISVGVIGASDKDVLDTLAILQATFKPEYLESM